MGKIHSFQLFTSVPIYLFLDMNELNIKLLELSEVAEAANVLSVAMLKNPLHIAAFQGQGEAERKQIEQMFVMLFKELPGVIFIAKRDGGMVGVMRMKSCVGRKVADDVDGIGNTNSIKGRTAKWHRAWAEHDPLEQHWHLGPIGVLPEYQGKGIGTKLMDRFCREVDTCRTGAYLETDLQHNVRFYERFGFKVVHECDVLNVKNSYMWRSPLI